jgi:hypothetical protein
VSQHQGIIEEAYALFEAGRFGAAEQLCVKIINEELAPAHATPLKQILASMAGINWVRNDRAKAFQILYRALTRFPAYSVTKHMMLALLKEGIGDGHYGEGPNNRRLVFGLGTGRSGSTSLTELLILQHGIYASHEHRPLIRWQGGDDGFLHNITRMRILSRHYKVVSDVAHWWLPRIETILAQYPDARFIIIRRDRAETVNSFHKIKGEGARGSANHWMEHDGSFWRKSNWDPTYPSFDANNIIEAIGMYWDAYYLLAEDKTNKYPSNVRIFDITALSDVAGQHEILTFAGIPNPVTVEKLHTNVGTIADGRRLVMNPFAQPAGALDRNDP